MNLSLESDAREQLIAAGIEIGLAARLASYVALVLEANKHVNLTGAKSVSEFLPHVLDSLTLLPYALDPLIDAGSGAGLPGIPLVIAGEISATLVDSVVKKTAFLKETVEKLELPVTVVTGRAEDVARNPEYREQYGSASGRGLSTASAVLELLSPFLRLGGLAMLQRGSLGADERRAFEDAALVLNCSLEGEVKAGENRRILLVRKTGPTPERFPRRVGIPEKRPLGWLKMFPGKQNGYDILE